MKKLFYLLIACFLACKQESKENVSVKNSQNQTVIITGTSYENGFNKSINFYDESSFYGTIYEDFKKDINGDSVQLKFRKIGKPKLFELISFGNNTFYKTRIIVSSGDSVTYTLKQGKLEFAGKNKEHYNFYLEMDRNYNAWSKLYLNKYNPDFKKYKRQCDSLYNKRVTFFNNYVKKHPTVSAEFKKIIQDDLRFEYLVNIIKPRSEIQSSWSVNTQEDLINIYERVNNQEGEFFNINGYINKISIEELFSYLKNSAFTLADTATGSMTSTGQYLKIKVNGADRYIPLYQLS